MCIRDRDEIVKMNSKTLKLFHSKITNLRIKKSASPSYKCAFFIITVYNSCDLTTYTNYKHVGVLYHTNKLGI